MSVDPVRRLQTLGHDITNLPVSKIPSSIDKCCFICVNAFESYRRNLGTGPINDAVSFAKTVKAFDYEIYVLQNPHKRNFLLYFEKIIASSERHCVFYYVGQMNQNLAKTKPETSFVFDDGTVPETDFLDRVIGLKKESTKLTLVTDTCPPGSIFDIKNGQLFGKVLPPLVLSIATVPDLQALKKIKHNTLDDQGIFTYHLTKNIKAMPEMTVEQLSESLRKVLREYGDLIVVGASSPNLLKESLFEVE